MSGITRIGLVTGTIAGLLRDDAVVGENYARLQEMFEYVVLPRNADLIPLYYHPDFVMETNQIRQGYSEFLADHIKYYAADSGISYSVEYDDESVVESTDRVACRMWITTQKGADDPKRIEVILIARYRDGLIDRVWELTLPNWASLDAFGS